MLNMFKTIAPATPPVSVQNVEGKRKAQRHAFAIVRSLKSRLTASGLSDTALWEYVKTHHGVTTRSELSEVAWVTLTARLSAAEKDAHLFSVLCDAIKAATVACRAYRVHADGTFRKVYDGIITDDISHQCQKHADATGCIVRLHGADGQDGIQMFEPAEFAPDPTAPPTAENDPKRPARAFGILRRDRQTRWIEIPFPDTPNLEAWGQAYAEEKGFDVEITTRDAVVLMHFTATPAPAPPETQIVHGVNDVTIDGQKWIILNHWDNQYHWVKLDGTLESHIATAENRTNAVNSLVASINNYAM